MKLICLVISITFSHIVMAQYGSVAGIVFDSIISNPHQYIPIRVQNTSYGTITDSTGSFVIDMLPVGSYKLVVDIPWCRNTKVVVKESQTTEVNIHMPKCFHHELERSNRCPTCNNSDNVIPIIYGLPTERTLRRAAEGKIIIGGCFVSDCNPIWYCKSDEQAF